MAEDPDVRLRLDAVKLLEESGRVPSGTLAQYQAYQAKEVQYQAKWAAAHPDEEFDLNDREHAKFVQANYPRALRPEVVDRAEFEVLADRKAEEKVAGLRRQMQEREAVASAQAQATAVSQSLEAAAGDDPFVKHFVKEASPAVTALAQEAMLVFSGVRQPNVSSPQHQALFALVGQAEPHISATGVQDQQGRRVVSSAEFARIPVQQRAAFVPLNQAPDVVAQLVSVQAVQQAKTRAEQVRALFPAATGPAPTPAPVTSPAPVVPRPTTPAAPPEPSYLKKFKFA